MADVYKQSFKQNYTHNIELSICGFSDGIHLRL